MKHLILALFLALGTVYSTSALACSGGCSNDGDCAANSCRYCETDFGVCSDCCEFTEAVNCPSACSWNGSECRNDSSIACGVIVPETPQKYRYLFFALLVAGVSAFFFIIKRRRPTS